MKRLTFALVFVALFAASAFAQSATLATPIQPASRATLKVGAFQFSSPTPNDPNTQASASCDLWVIDANGNRADVWTVQMVGAEANQFILALVTPAANETGSTARKLNFRILKYLHDNCATFATPCSASLGVDTATVNP